MNTDRISTRRAWSPILSSAIVVAFGLQLLRVLFPLFQHYLRDALGIPSLNLAPIALGLFGLSFLAGLLPRFLGAHSAMWLCIIGLAAARLAEQIATDSSLDLFLAGIGVVMFTWYLPLAVGVAWAQGRTSSQNLASGILLGLAIDGSLHATAGTVDLSWQPGLPALITTAFLALLLITSFRAWHATSDLGSIQGLNWSQALPLACFGPWLFLQMLVFQNVARVVTLVGWSLPETALVLIGIGNLLAISLAGWSLRRRVHVWTWSAAIALVATTIALELPPLASAVALLIAQSAAAVLLMRLLCRPEVERPASQSVPAAFAIGQVLLVVLAFLYYVGFDIPLGFPNSMLILASGLLVALGGLLAGRKMRASSGSSRFAARAAMAVLLLPLSLSLSWRAPIPVEAGSDVHSVRIMTYNIHGGFDVRGRMSLEDMAQVIESEGAEVIALQEVVRGFLTSGSVDSLAWLSERLNLPYVFGPTADRQWGNAILSRYPIGEAETLFLSPQNLPIRRAYTRVRISLGSRDLTVFATHLHHLPADSLVRQQQVEEILAAWSGAPLSVILGDLNATPDSAEMQLLAAEGLLSVTALLGAPQAFTFYSAAPDRQIDYIWISPDLDAGQLSIPQTTASDHLPVAVTVEVP